MFNVLLEFEVFLMLHVTDNNCLVIIIYLFSFSVKVFNENLHKIFCTLFELEYFHKFYGFCLAAITASNLTIIFTLYVSTHEMNRLRKCNFLSTIYKKQIKWTWIRALSGVNLINIYQLWHKMASLHMKKQLQNAGNVNSKLKSLIQHNHTKNFVPTMIYGNA